MTEQECLAILKAPGERRTGKPYWGCVIQICITSMCDKTCYHCTQASNFQRTPWYMSLEHFEQALHSLKGFYGTVGVFGGNPALHPQFPGICNLVRKHIPVDHAGIWCNNPVTLDKAREMRSTFSPVVSNLNVHLDRKAWQLFREGWPEAHPVGLTVESRHAPVFVSMKDLNIPEEERWRLISTCDIAASWSAMIGVFRGQLRAWFCEVAGAQSMLHQEDPDYPDTGIFITDDDGDEILYGREELHWWQLPMTEGHFAYQVRKHCHECGVPLRGFGELSQSASGVEQVSQTHLDVAKPKRKGREVEEVTELVQLGMGRIEKVIKYLQNSQL